MAPLNAAIFAILLGLFSRKRQPDEPPEEYQHSQTQPASEAGPSGLTSDAARLHKSEVTQAQPAVPLTAPEEPLLPAHSVYARWKPKEWEDHLEKRFGIVFTGPLLTFSSTPRAWFFTHDFAVALLSNCFPEMSTNKRGPFK